MFVISIVFLKKLKILFLFTILLNPCKICLTFPLSSTLSTILSSALNKIHDITTFSMQSTKQHTLETVPLSSSTPSMSLEVEPIGFKPLSYRNDNNVTHVFDVINSTTESIFYSTEIITPDTNLGNATPVNEWNCHCWNSTNLLGFELECHCEGEGLLRIPQKLHTNIQRLAIANAGLKTIRKVGLKRYSILEDIMITDLREFTMIEPGAFEYVRQLRSIYISGAPSLQYVTADAFFGISDTLKILRIVNCGLLKVPDLQLISPSTILSMVDLEGNQISKIDQHAFQIKSGELVLDGNQLCSIENYAFAGSQIAKLSLKNNRKLHKLHEKTFSGILNILELDLSSTSIEELPTDGLDTLEILKIQNTHSLRTIPSVYNFKNLQYAYLTHSFHCCAFKFPSRHDPTLHEQRMQYISQLHEQCINKGYNVSPVQTSTLLPTDDQSGDFENHFESFHGEMKIVPLKKRRRRRLRSVENLKVNTQHLSQHHRVAANTFFNVTDDLSLPITGAPLPVLEGGGHHHHEGESDFVMSSNMFDDLGVFHATAAEITPISALCGNLTRYLIDVKCYPTPDALTPCEDVMGSDWLRGSVWVVVLLAVFGNTAVLIVLFSNRSDVTVPKFLMSNLAFADFCMGLYLLLIASIDAHSIGEYFNVAYDWQYGAGCKAAGFLTVFASHLSVFTLTIITLERWFAITYAIYLNKRLKLRSAAHIMLFGWIYAILMAGLPLFGISNYSSTSICLPMEARDSLDIAYLITVLGVNGLAFFVILICYGQIYFSLGKETRQAARHASRGEMTVAKKMALLVFTNFACWAPIAFFGLTALAGYPLIDVAKSKILLVFFYPLNSCANPYLYAILTAQYRRDLFILLSKYGFCVQRAQQYKMTYSLPVTNHTYPVPLIDRNSISGGRRSSSLNRGNNKNRDEAYV